MEPALAAAGTNAEWTRLFKELTHGLNTGIVVWEGGHPLWRGEKDIQTDPLGASLGNDVASVSERWPTQPRRRPQDILAT